MYKCTFITYFYFLVTWKNAIFPLKSVPTLAIWIEGKLAAINVLFSVLLRKLLAESEILKNSKLST